MSDTQGPGFVSNYPPFARWSPEGLDGLAHTLGTPPARDVPLGLYVHLPFCRKRCTFCYFRVYTETPAAQIRAYIEAVLQEARLWAQQAVVAGRTAQFVYFGGGTPSYLSVSQIRQLVEGLRAILPWSDDAEFTFECEPGTLRQAKVDALAELGVTRLSLGVESFNGPLLEANGRAHGAKHIGPAIEMVRKASIPQLNIDLIAGMLGETDATWQESIQGVIDHAPDSVTIYQMEIPANTQIAKALREGQALSGTLSTVQQRTQWAAQAFDALAPHGYTLCSGYTTVRGTPDGRFVYRDSLWKGADLLPLGVSSFGQIQGHHVQNDKHLASYMETLDQGAFPWQRGYAMSAEDRFRREWILQLKLGKVTPAAFQRTFGIDPMERFASVLEPLIASGQAHYDGHTLRLSKSVWLTIDALLPAFYQGDAEAVEGV